MLARLARPGLIAHAVLYVVIGLLALQVAANGGRRQADGNGAIPVLAPPRDGSWPLRVLVVGLVAPVLWRGAPAPLWGPPARPPPPAPPPPPV